MNDTEGESKLGFLQLDRRKHNNFKDWAVIITLTLNLAGLVWTAAKWSSAIEQLQISTSAAASTLGALTGQLNKLDGRVGILEYQVNVEGRASRRAP